MAFRGTFDFSLDAKHRLTVPAKLRARFADGLVLAAGLEPCVGIWRPADYEAWVGESLAGHSRLSPDYRTLKRFFTANSFEAELDSAGRVMLPQNLRAHASLEKDVTLIGADESLEVWDRAAWGEYNARVGAGIADIAANLGAPGAR